MDLPSSWSSAVAAVLVATVLAHVMHGRSIAHFWLNLGSRIVTGFPPARMLFFGRGMRLPPVVHHGDILSKVKKYGMWQRHRVDRELAATLGDIYCMVPPIAFGASTEDPDLHPPVKLIVWVSDPDMVQKLLTDRHTFPSRGPSGLDGSVKDGLVGLPSGERHSFHRRVIGSFMTPVNLKVFSGTVQEELDVMLDKWESACTQGVAVNAYYDLTTCTEEIIGIIGLGQRFGAQQLAEADNQEHSDRSFMLKRAMLATGLGPAMLWLLSSRVDLAREARCRVETRDKTRAHVLQAIEAAKTAGGQPNMVSAMFEAEDPEHGKLTAKEIEEEFITLRGAGHETTSNTTSWVMLLLARNPDVQRRVRAEVEAHVAGRTVTFDETEKLRLCRMTVFEALRLYPTVPAYPRLSVAPTKFGDYDLPTGSFVAVSQPVLNRSAALWGDDADEFRPERFDKEGFSLDLLQFKAFGCPGLKIAPHTGAARPNSAIPGDHSLPKGHPYGFVPFGAGRRTCIGQRLAMMEAVQIVGSVIKNFKIELESPDTEVAEVADISLGPKEGLFIKLSQW